MKTSPGRRAALICYPASATNTRLPCGKVFHVHNNLVTDSLLLAKDMLAILHVQEVGECVHVCALNNLEICFLLNNKLCRSSIRQKPTDQRQKEENRPFAPLLAKMGHVFVKGLSKNALTGRAPNIQGLASVQPPLPVHIKKGLLLRTKMCF